jgi:UDP-N-acetylmuramoyl-tripeptide--D-alanyl-D-alanine ligase
MAFRAVKKTLISLITAEARFALFLHRPKIIAITGNVGKTTAKDAIYAALAGRFRVRKSAKSYNSDVGLPLSILGLQNPWSNPLRWIIVLIQGVFSALNARFPKILVLEVGADQPGDISSVASWLAPDIGVFTGIPEVPVHIENFPSRNALVKEKRSLFEHVRPNGVIIANADLGVEEVLSGIAIPVVTYGFNAACDLAASQFRTDREGGIPRGISARVVHGQEAVTLSIQGALGKPRIYAALAALAVADLLGIALNDAARALSAWAPPAGRMRILSGVNGSYILDDSYNASPEALRAALEALAETGAKRRIAILGDMLELGAYSEVAHREAGIQVATRCDLLITVGERARDIARAAQAVGMASDHVREYGAAESELAGKELAPTLSTGDVVLVKGSQGIRMERAVRALMQDPKEAPSRTVRQDAAWSKR